MVAPSVPAGWLALPESSAATTHSDVTSRAFTLATNGRSIGKAIGVGAAAGAGAALGMFLLLLAIFSG